MSIIRNFGRSFKTRNVPRSLFTILLLLIILPSGNALGTGGDLIWEDVFNLAAGGNIATCVTFRRNRIFVGGMGNQSDGQAAGVVRTYNAKTGQLLWDDVFDAGGGNTRVFEVAARGNRVFAAAGGDDLTNTSVWIVRSYNARNGDLIWEDRFENDGKNTEARAVSTAGNTVFVGGRAENSSGRSEWLMRTYYTSTGDLVWQDRFGINGQDQAALSITVLGARIFVSGGSPNPLTTGDWLVRAYDARTGEVLWEDRLGTAGGNFSALSITARHDKVFAAGIGKTLTENDWIVRAYDASSGNLIWEDRFNISMGTDSGPGAKGITANRFGVFATGGINSLTEKAMIVKSYDSATGDLEWENRVQFDPAGGPGGKSISVKGNRVYATGEGSIDSIDEWILRSYDAPSGDVIWEDRFSLEEGLNEPHAIVAKKRRVYAVGTAIGNVGNNLDHLWIVRAHEAR
jgi:hypothetical protein